MKYNSRETQLMNLTAIGTFRLNNLAARVIDAAKGDRYEMEVESDVEATFRKSEDGRFVMRVYGLVDYYFGGPRLRRKIDSVFPNHGGVFKIEVKSKDVFTIKPYCI